jgi:hypothetical protein
VTTDPPVPSSTPPPVLEEEVPRPPYDHVGHGAVLISPCALASHGADAWGRDRLEGTPCPVFPAAAPPLAGEKGIHAGGRGSVTTRPGKYRTIA